MLAPAGAGLVGTSQRELFDLGARMEGLEVAPVLVCDGLAPLYEFVRDGGGIALVGDLGDLDRGATGDGVAYVRLDHPVFRQREAQVQTMPGRRLPWSATQFTQSLAATLRAGRPDGPTVSTTRRARRRTPPGATVVVAGVRGCGGVVGRRGVAIG